MTVACALREPQALSSEARIHDDHAMMYFTFAADTALSSSAHRVSAAVSALSYAVRALCIVVLSSAAHTLSTPPAAPIPSISVLAFYDIPRKSGEIFRAGE